MPSLRSWPCSRLLISTLCSSSGKGKGKGHVHLTPHPRPSQSPHHRPPSIPRLFSTDSLAHPSHKTQIYLLQSRDPFVNLSIEHHLLQHTPPESTILLLYVNKPCVVFGRNQNPWLEVNLGRLAQIRRDPGAVEGWTAGKEEEVQLVRRRSGGGTVFHDEGNVNFSVICPPAVFDRNKHAEMVVRALKSLSRPNTRVNVRHDIVMDTTPIESNPSGTFKISGSAYKLTRLRSLHHGTCLLRSPNLGHISSLLRSPAEPFIKARGVDSVRSPVRNVDLNNEVFIDAVRAEFERMYGKADVVEEEVSGKDAMEVGKVREGCEELRSRSWIYGQTPRFAFSTFPTEDDPRPRPEVPSQLHLQFEARHGVIESFGMQGPHSSPFEVDASTFVGGSMADFTTWTDKLAEAGLDKGDANELGRWMDGVLGVDFSKPEG